MPQMMPMLWMYMFLFTFILLMISTTLAYYLYTPIFISFNYKLFLLNGLWVW